MVGTPLVAQNTFEGQTIREVVFQPAQQPLPPEELAAFTELKAGQTFQAEKASSTIDRLFASGRYRDITVEAVPSASGVVVRIVTEPQLFVGHISIEGDVGKAPTPQELIEASRLQLGTPLESDDVAAAEQRLHRLLYNNGLFEHLMSVEFEDIPEIQQRNIRFVIDTGPRAKYSEFKIEGDPELSAGKIYTATGWRWRLIHLWRKVTQERTNKGIVGVERKYQDEGWLTAEVSAAPLQYDPSTGRVDTTFRIDAGPKVEVRATEFEVSKGVLRRYVPIFLERAVDRDLLVVGAGALRDYFQSQGYFDAEVDFRQVQPDPEHLVVEYIVSPGMRYKLVSVQIQGNRFFSTADLRERMFLQEAGLLRLRHGRFSSTFLDRDKESIVNLYKGSGFQDVEVTSSVLQNFNGKPGEVGVVIRIDEGPLWTVSDLSIEGAGRLNPASYTAQLGSIEGQPYSELNVARDRDLLLTRFRAAGYPDVSFRWQATPNPDNHTMALVYEIEEGRSQRVREVVLTGIDTTRMSLVNRQVTLQKGDPLSLVAMSSIQQRLYELGIFSRIDMAIQNQAGATDSKRVLFDFHEASRYSLALGFGAEFARIGGTTNDLTKPEGAAGISPRVSVDLSRLNLWGLGHSIALRGRLSNLEQVASFNYIAPRFRNVEGRNITFTTTYQVARDVRTFSSRREEAAIQISQQLSKPSNLLIRFAYRRVSASNIVIPRLLIPQLLQPVRIGILSGNYVQDRRDNPANASRGIYNTIDIGIASNVFGSQRSFLRSLTRNATYHPITTSGIIFARQTSVGLIFPFRVPAGVQEAEAIPLPERFYGGGSATHRGFPTNQAGPRDPGANTPGAPPTGFPLGGNALIFNTVELRFPLLGENIGGVVFHDAGNVYSRISDISFRVRQRDETDFNYMVHAVGFGVRYKTPVGPIRADLAYSINPPRYRGFEGTTQELLTCGSPEPSPACTSDVRRVSHFQFFFSIGQTF